MGVSTSHQNFIQELVKRGLGIYGHEKMAEIAYNSGIALLDDDSVDYLPTESDHDIAIQKLIVNYSKINLPAKMTAMVLAKKFSIPIPAELKKKKKRSRFLSRLRM